MVRIRNNYSGSVSDRDKVFRIRNTGCLFGCCSIKEIKWKIFQIYFCMLREENDVDAKLGADNLFDMVKGLEKAQLEAAITWVMSLHIRTYFLNFSLNQCFGSVFIWSGSGSSILDWILIRITIQSRSRVLMTKKSKKKNCSGKRNLKFLIKNCNLHIPRPP